jgi:periplasmic protein TonB
LDEVLRSRTAYAAAIVAASILVHLVLLLFVGRTGRTLSPPVAQTPVQIAVIEKPAPPPPPPPVVEAPPKPQRRVARVPKFIPPPPQQAPRPAQPPPQAPPPPTVEAPQTTQQPIVLPGVTLESTTQAGGFAVPTGNTLYGEPPRKAADPGAAKPYKADKYVAAAQVTELPGVSSMPDNLKRFYPHDAEQRGFEGDVVLRLLIDADGSIAKVDVVSDPGEGLGAAGVRAIRAFRFHAGKLNGQPVATTITYTLQFRIAD